MPKNIVICCDGTGNEVEANLSNVLKLYRIVRKNEDQVVFYHPGVGTISDSEAWSRLKSDALGVWGLLTGYGLDEDVLCAYRFLIDTYAEGDQVYLFGFSRGAYTMRVLAGFLYLIGLLERPQRDLASYALTAYKRDAQEGEFEIAWRFERVIGTRRVPIKLIGVWDTVSSVIVPRPDRLYLPSLQALPYTRTNPRGNFSASNRHRRAAQNVSDQSLGRAAKLSTKRVRQYQCAPAGHQTSMVRRCARRHRRRLLRD